MMKNQQYLILLKNFKTKNIWPTSSIISDLQFGETVILQSNLDISGASIQAVLHQLLYSSVYTGDNLKHEDV